MKRILAIAVSTFAVFASGATTASSVHVNATGLTRFTPAGAELKAEPVQSPTGQTVHQPTPKTPVSRQGVPGPKVKRPLSPPPASPSVLPGMPCSVQPVGPEPGCLWNPPLVLCPKPVDGSGQWIDLVGDKNGPICYPDRVYGFVAPLGWHFGDPIPPWRPVS